MNEMDHFHAQEPDECRRTGSLAVPSPDFELAGALKPELPIRIPEDEIPHDCGKPGTHPYTCMDCGWLPF